MRGAALGGITAGLFALAAAVVAAELLASNTAGAVWIAECAETEMLPGVMRTSVVWDDTIARCAQIMEDARR